MSKEPLRILFDADMVVFRATSAVETPIQWDDNLWTLHADAGEAQVKVDDTILTLTEKVLNHYKYEGNYEIVMCFSDTENFRKKYCRLIKSIELINGNPPATTASKSGSKTTTPVTKDRDWKLMIVLASLRR